MVSLAEVLRRHGPAYEAQFGSWWLPSHRAAVQAILSWVNPYSPIGPLLSSLTQPFLRPLQRRVPMVANVDLSPLVLIIVLQLILMVPVAWLEMNVVRLF